MLIKKPGTNNSVDKDDNFDNLNKKLEKLRINT